MKDQPKLYTHNAEYAREHDRKSGYSKAFREAHEGEIILHQAAKKAFDESGLKKLPSVKSLNAEFSALLTEKKAAYADYHKAQDEMRELLIHKANAEYIFGIDDQKEKGREHQYE